MAVTPVWQAATAGSPGNAGHVNQFLGAHAATFLYEGVVKSSQATGSAVYSDTLSQWLSQSITTAVGQTAIGYVQLQLAAVGGSPALALIAPLTVGLYADSGGVPTGSALASTTVAGSYVYSSPFWVTVPLAASALTPSTTYHLVISLVGSAGHYYVWQRSTQVSGAATSVNGSAWTNQTYGLMYRVYDQAAAGQLQLIYEDNGARWTQFTYGTTGAISQVAEYVTGQAAGGYLQTISTLTYANGLLTGVA